DSRTLFPIYKVMAELRLSWYLNLCHLLDLAIVRSKGEAMSNPVSLTVERNQTVFTSQTVS
ncbi:MAG: hypothetical protein ACO3J5_04115, partial [Pseudohongiellaceae bacterium]